MNRSFGIKSVVRPDSSALIWRKGAWNDLVRERSSPLGAAYLPLRRCIDALRLQPISALAVGAAVGEILLPKNSKPKGRRNFMTTEKAPDNTNFRMVAGTLLVLLLGYGALALAGVVR